MYNLNYKFSSPLLLLYITLGPILWLIELRQWLQEKFYNYE